MLTQACVPIYSACNVPRETSELAYFLAMLGTALVVWGIQQAGIGRERIRAEGGSLVVAVGVIISTLGFLAINLLPLISSTLADIGFSLGVVGAALLAFGLAKSIGGRIGLSTNPGHDSLYQPVHRPSFETSAIVVIISILVASAVLLGSVSYHPLCACTLVSPSVSREALTLDSSTLNSSTNMTLNLRNASTVTIALVGYYVGDQTGQQYSNANWSGPTIMPNSLIPTVITIDGSSFVFQTGNVYTVTMITSRNNQFIFTVAT